MTRIVKCDIGTAHVIMEPSNVRKKIREPPNVTKVQSYEMLVLRNVRMVS